MADLVVVIRRPGAKATTYIRREFETAKSEIGRLADCWNRRRRSGCRFGTDSAPVSDTGRANVGRAGEPDGCLTHPAHRA